VKEETQLVSINSETKLVSQKNHAKTTKLKTQLIQHAHQLNNAKTVTHHHHHQAKPVKINVSPQLDGTNGKSTNTVRLLDQTT